LEYLSIKIGPTNGIIIIGFSSFQGYCPSINCHSLDFPAFSLLRRCLIEFSRLPMPPSLSYTMQPSLSIGGWQSFALFSSRLALFYIPFPHMWLKAILIDALSAPSSIS